MEQRNETTSETEETRLAYEPPDIEETAHFETLALGCFGTDPVGCFGGVTSV